MNQTLKIQSYIGTDTQEVSLQNMLQRICEEAVSIARNVQRRTYYSAIRHSLIRYRNLLTEGYRQYQLASGEAQQRLNPAYYAGGEYYIDNCKPVPENWLQKIDSLINRLNMVFFRYLEQTEGRGNNQEFWQEWHAGWETKVVPQIQAIAQEFE